MRNILKNSKGFTLVELLIAIAIFGVVIAGLVNSKISQQGQTITQQQAVEMQQTTRAGMYLMVSKIRSAGYNPHTQDYDQGITTAGANTFTFTRVANDDGVDNNGANGIDEDGELETLSYSLQDADLDGDNDIAENNIIIAENIQNLAFLYFDEDGVITADLDAMRSVQITLTATTDVNQLARSTANNTRTLTTVVYLRNLGF